MTGWALLLEYDGGPFVGWQRQDNGMSVQSVLEDAAGRLTGAAVTSVAAGRTDAGVHATGQVALLEMPDRLDARQVRDGLNYHMRPHPVVVLLAAPAAPGWSPRFSASSRHYVYRILNRRARRRWNWAGCGTWSDRWTPGSCTRRRRACWGTTILRVSGRRRARRTARCARWTGWT